MNVEITRDKMNPLLKRREINFRITHKEATPSREAVKTQLATLLNSQPEFVIIEKLSTIFGKQETLGYAGIYQDAERVRQVAHEHLLKRGLPKTKEEKEEKKKIAAEAPKPTKPVTETKEEAKPKEEKKEAAAEAKPPKPETKPKGEAKPKEEKKEVTAEAKPQKTETKPKGEAKPAKEEKTKEKTKKE